MPSGEEGPPYPACWGGGKGDVERREEVKVRMRGENRHRKLCGGRAGTLKVVIWVPAYLYFSHVFYENYQHFTKNIGKKKYHCILNNITNTNFLKLLLV